MTQIQEKKLPEGWIETTLGKVIFPVSETFYFGNKKKVHFLNTGDILEGKLLHNNFSDISILPGQAKKSIRKNDILFSEIRPANKRYMLVDFECSLSVASTKLMVLRGKEGVDINFIYKIITSENILKEFQVIAESRSGTFPQITFEAISYFPIFLPPLQEQQAIAKILSSFDDKIELLREQNETLEKIGQEIFKEWFGKYKVGDELPEGWRVGKLGEEFDITIGRTPPRLETQWFSNNQKDYKWISIKDIGNCGTYIFETSEFLTKEAVEKFNIPIIPENTTILSFKMTVGKLTITTEKMLSNEAIAHLKLKENSKITSEYIYTYLQNLDFNSLGSTSSIVTAINSTIIKNLEFLIPENKILEKFNEVIKNIFQKIKINSEEIETLSKTRDELLPKLMKGEVRVV